MGEKYVKRTFDPDWMLMPADDESKMPSPVTVYQLSPEELAEYDNLRKPTGKAPINFNLVRKPKEAEEMLAGENGTEITDNIVQAVIDRQGNKGFEVFDKKENPDIVGQEPPKPRTRLEVAREKLSSEEYLRLKEKSKTDHEIKILFKIANDVLVELKKEWGLPVVPIMPPRKQKPEQERPGNTPQPDPVSQPEPQLNESRPPGLTIVQAMELREELSDDVTCLNNILAVSGRAELTERVILMLETQRNVRQAHLDRINEVFSSTVLPL